MLLLIPEHSGAALLVFFVGCVYFFVGWDSGGGEYSKGGNEQNDYRHGSSVVTVAQLEGRATVTMIGLSPYPTTALTQASVA